MDATGRSDRRLPPERISALDDAEQHDDDRHYHEDVDEASERIGGDNPEQPQDEEDDDECGKHRDFCCDRQP